MNSLMCQPQRVEVLDVNTPALSLSEDDVLQVIDYTYKHIFSKGGYDLGDIQEDLYQEIAYHIIKTNQKNIFPNQQALYKYAFLEIPRLVRTMFSKQNHQPVLLPAENKLLMQIKMAFNLSTNDDVLQLSKQISIAAIAVEVNVSPSKVKALIDLINVHYVSFDAMAENNDNLTGKAFIYEEEELGDTEENIYLNYLVDGLTPDSNKKEQSIYSKLLITSIKEKAGADVIETITKALDIFTKNQIGEINLSPKDENEIFKLISPLKPLFQNAIEEIKRNTVVAPVVKGER